MRLFTFMGTYLAATYHHHTRMVNCDYDKSLSGANESCPLLECSCIKDFISNSPLLEADIRIDYFILSLKLSIYATQFRDIFQIFSLVTLPHIITQCLHVHMYHPTSILSMGLNNTTLTETLTLVIKLPFAYKLAKNVRFPHLNL